MKLKRTFFPAKVLLFGEHLLLHGSSALSIPFHEKGGEWAFLEEESRAKQQNLADFAQSAQLRNLNFMDVDAFQKDVALGLYFDSNIPSGYGLGSSGALCAAVYDRYAFEKTEDLGELKRIFSKMESFFHGNSSGIDPLTSYVDSVLAFDANQTGSYDGILEAREGNWQPYLLNTGIKRETAPLVKWFSEQMVDDDFHVACQNMILFTHALIVMFLTAPQKEREFGEKLQWLSNMQYNFLYRLIPEEFWEDWAAGLESQEYYMKLCGAGGGGYILVWAKNGFNPPLRWDLTPILSKT